MTLNIPDQGPWKAIRSPADNVHIESSEFTHDARLYLNGEFDSADDELKYAEDIARRLNIPAPIANFKVDLDGNMLTVGKYSVKLTSYEAELVEGLSRKYPNTATREFLMDCIYGVTRDMPDMKIIDIFICHIRKKIKHTGLEIKNVRGKGYTFDDSGVISPNE